LLHFSFARIKDHVIAMCENNSAYTLSTKDRISVESVIFPDSRIKEV